jgi:hypothetical protein
MSVSKKQAEEARDQKLANMIGEQLKYAMRESWNGQLQNLKKELIELITPKPQDKLRVERYSFALNKTLLAGHAKRFEMVDSPKRGLSITRIVANAPCAGFVTIQSILIDGKPALVGGSEDAFCYGPTSVGIHLALPPVTRYGDVSASCEYAGFCPPPFNVGQDFMFCLTFQGDVYESY